MIHKLTSLHACTIISKLTYCHLLLTNRNFQVVGQHMYSTCYSYFTITFHNNNTYMCMGHIERGVYKSERTKGVSSSLPLSLDERYIKGIILYTWTIIYMYMYQYKHSRIHNTYCNIQWGWIYLVPCTCKLCIPTCHLLYTKFTVYNYKIISLEKGTHIYSLYGVVN